MVKKHSVGASVYQTQDSWEQRPLMGQLAPGSASEGTLPGLTSWASAGRVAALPVPQGGGAGPDTAAQQWSVCCPPPLPRKIMSWTHRGPASQLPPQEVTARSLHGPYSLGAAPTDCGGTPRIQPRSPGLRLLRNSPASARSSGQTPGARRRRHTPHTPDLPCCLSSRAARLRFRGIRVANQLPLLPGPATASRLSLSPYPCAGSSPVALPDPPNPSPTASLVHCPPTSVSGWLFLYKFFWLAATALQAPRPCPGLRSRPPPPP